jgi:NAD(P)-dependent dehydrogenase (short-subunit alcohol dehydrogenase family)
MAQTVLITGASSGIGRSTAQLFASNGWNVVATMRNPSAESKLTGLDNVLVTRLDVQDHESVVSAFETGVAHFGAVDALINNAGFGLYGVFESTSKEKIQEQFDVNVFGVMDTIQVALPYFRKQKSGVIINVSSGGGIFTLPLISLYHATKFALEGFSESLAYELGSLNILVKIVEPGGVGTNFSKRSGEEYVQSPAPQEYGPFVEHTNAIFNQMRAARLMTPEEVASVIFTATTDGTTRLRYEIGEDIKPLTHARRTLSEQAYVDFMRSRFLRQS